MPEFQPPRSVTWILGGLVAAGILPLLVGFQDQQQAAQAIECQIIDDRIDEIEQRLFGTGYITPGPLRLAEQIAVRRAIMELEADIDRVMPEVATRIGTDRTPVVTPARVREIAEIVRAEVLRTREVARVSDGWLMRLLLTSVNIQLGLSLWLWHRLRQPIRVAAGAVVGSAESGPTARSGPQRSLPPPTPAVRPPSAVRTSRPVSTTSGVIPAVGRLHGRVLLIEDNPINQRVTVRQLGELGLDVELASNAEVGLEHLRRSAYAAALMDLQLPGMDGMIATRIWRVEESLTGRPRLPIIALTANAMGLDRDACHAAGMDGYLTKPARLQDLYRVLSPCLGGPPPEPLPLPQEAPLALSPDELPALHDSSMWARLRVETSASDPHMIEELMADLRRQAPTQVADLASALAAGESEKARAIAHRLKGSAGMLGLPRLAAAAMAVEQPAKAGDLLAAAAGIDELRRVITATFADPAVAALG